MLEALLKVLPVFLTFFLGYFLKRAKFFSVEDGSLFLKLLFFVAAPALTYLSVSTVEITPSLMIFPLIAALTLFTLYAVNVLITQKFSIPRPTLGVYITGTLIANTSFALPFLLAIYGQEAVARFAMYDLMGGFLTYVFVYSIAVQHGDHRPSNKFVLQKILISPPVWALMAGLVANFSGFQTPELVNQFLRNLAGLVSPLIMLSLGLYFSPKLFHPKLITMGILTRMGGGMLIGFGLSALFGLTGLDRAVAIICTSAPIGFNTLTFATMEKLDLKFAASLVSVSIALGLVLVPLLTVVLSG